MDIGKFTGNIVMNNMEEQLFCDIREQYCLKDDKI